MEMTGQLHALATLAPGNEHRFTGGKLDPKAQKPRSVSDLSATDCSLLSCQVYFIVTILTELSQDT